MEIKFETEDEKENIEYTVKFDYNSKEYKEVCFIYDLKLFYKKGFGIERTKEQNLGYTEKFKYFKEFLQKTKQENRMDDLYLETIKLYSKYSSFELLINIFIYIYDNKIICPKFLYEFKNFNEKLTPKLNDPKSGFIEFKDSLKEYIDVFKKIMDQSKKIIESNSYDFVEFYGLIFCYLNHYDFDTFTTLFTFLSKEANESLQNLFDILLIYNRFLIRKIKMEKDFLKKFIIYSAEIKEKENYNNFINKALPYLDEINLYLNIINSSKEKIILIKDFKAIEISHFNKYSNNFNELKEDIEDILNFSEEKKFWCCISIMNFGQK